MPSTEPSPDRGLADPREALRDSSGLAPAAMQLAGPEPALRCANCTRRGATVRPLTWAPVRLSVEGVTFEFADQTALLVTTACTLRMTVWSVTTACTLRMT